jgi:hypothetical protein
MGNSASLSRPCERVPNDRRLHAAAEVVIVPRFASAVHKARKWRQQRRRVDVLRDGARTNRLIGDAVEDVVDRVIAVFMDKSPMVEARDILAEASLPVISSLFARHADFPSSWLMVMLFFGGVNDAVRAMILDEFSTRNTAQASLYALFMATSSTAMSGFESVRDVLHELVDAEILRPGRGNVRRVTSAWGWNVHHPLVRHIDLMEQLIANDGWNRRDQNTDHLVVVGKRGMRPGTQVVHALEGTEMFQLVSEPIGRGSYGAVFRLVNASELPVVAETVSKRKRASQFINETDDEFLLKLGLSGITPQSAMDELLGSGFALASVWLSFIVNAPTVGLLFRGKAFSAEMRDPPAVLDLFSSESGDSLPVTPKSSSPDSSSPDSSSPDSSSPRSVGDDIDDDDNNTSAQYGILMDNVGDHLFADVAAEAACAMLAQVWFALAAFHRYTKRLHNDISGRNVTVKRGLSPTEIEGVRYVVSESDAVLMDSSDAATESTNGGGETLARQPLFENDSISADMSDNIVDATTVTVVDVAVNGETGSSFFVSLIDFGLLESFENVRTNVADVYAFVISQTIHASDRVFGSGLERVWESALVRDIEKSNRLNKFLNDIFVDAGKAIPVFEDALRGTTLAGKDDQARFNVFVQMDDDLVQFERKSNLREYLENVKERTGVIHGQQMQLFDKTVRNGVLLEEWRMRVLQGMLMERMYGDGMFALFMYGMHVVGNDFVPFVMYMLKTRRTNARQFKHLSMGDMTFGARQAAEELAMLLIYKALGVCFVRMVIPIAKRAAFTKMTLPVFSTFAKTKINIEDDLVDFMNDFTWSDEAALILEMVDALPGVVIRRGNLVKEVMDVGTTTRIVNMVPTSEAGNELLLKSFKTMPIYRIGNIVKDVKRGDKTLPSKKRKTTDVRNDSETSLLATATTTTATTVQYTLADIHELSLIELSSVRARKHRKCHVQRLNARTMRQGVDESTDVKPF